VQSQDTPGSLSPSLVERREAYERARAELKNWRNKLEQFDHIHPVIERKVRLFESEVKQLRLAWWELRQAMIARIVAAKGVIDPAAQVQLLEELSMDPDWRLEAVDDALRRLADGGRRHGRKGLDQEPALLADRLVRAQKAENIKLLNPRKTWADIAGMPGIDTTERRLREWRLLLKRRKAAESAGKKSAD
jgi:hypothetical protein